MSHNGSTECILAVSWEKCLSVLKHEISSEQFNTWLKPLKSHFDGESLHLFAANKFVLSWVKDEYYVLIVETLTQIYGADAPPLVLELLVKQPELLEKCTELPTYNQNPGNSPALSIHDFSAKELLSRNSKASSTMPLPKLNQHKSNVKPEYTFENFVEGKSNQLARAAAVQVAENPGHSYNPLFLYGGTGLGKTHLIHAVGNGIVANKPNAKIVYMHSERFVQDMVKALQNNAIEDFKRFYRSVDALLIDDIQFFAKKDRSQEEFFHTFNALLEGNQQIILTSDRYPKEIDGVEDRLKSRFGWGLTVVIEPPELETRVAILMRKAHENKIDLPNEVAFFIAKRLRSNVRELEGALNRVIANANFTGRPITIDFVRDALRDLLALQDKLVTIDNIIKTVADYYKIKVSDILSKRRTRSVARPRQIAMALSKELTNQSLPEIGNAFGGKDHTTVLHAVRKVTQLRAENHDVKEDYKNLIRTLSS